MSTNPRTIVCDVDGTLVNSNNQISPQTKEVLLKAQELGHRLIIASGRADAGIQKLADELKLKDYDGVIISYNGSKATRVQNNEVLYNQPISLKLAREVIDHLTQFDLIVMVDDKKNLYIKEDSFHTITHENFEMNIIEHELYDGYFNLVEVKNLLDILDFEPNKIITSANYDVLKEHYQDMKRPFENSLMSVFSAPFYYEFTAKGVNKGNALAHVIEKLNIPKESLIGFGDAQNDIDMLKLCHDSFAMDNAPLIVKQAAKYTTLSNDQDGIAVALKKLFNI